MARLCFDGEQRPVPAAKAPQLGGYDHRQMRLKCSSR
jgi:hypothetical protein